jgi:uncharacterized protein DUF2252
MQSASDIFLGWFRAPQGHDYYVRQFRDMKISAKPETFKPQTLVVYATMCGWVLARSSFLVRLRTQELQVDLLAGEFLPARGAVEFAVLHQEEV